MFYKEAKNTLTEIDEIYEDFVIEIATKVSTKVKGKIFYGYANIEDMWYIIIKTRELGEKRFYERYKGEGNIAEMIHNTFALGRRKFFADKEMPKLSSENFTGTKTQQLRFF